MRTQFSDALNVEIAKRSLEAFRDFGRRPGWEIDLKQVGYMFVLSRESDVEKFERSVALQNEYGLASRMLTAGEARELCPLVQGDDILAGAFSPGDGHATPEGVVQGYAFAARAHGAEIHVNCEVLDINISGAEITEVVTSHGSIRTSTVICAAGAWSRSCGAMVGVDLPVTPLRRQILFTEPMDGLPAQMPMTIDFESSFYFHREGPGLLMGMSDPHEKPGLQRRDNRRLDPWPDGGGPAAGAADRRRRYPRRLGRAVRDDAQTTTRSSARRRASRASSTRPASPDTDSSRAPPSARSSATWFLRRPPFVDIEPLGVERFDDVRASPGVQRCISDLHLPPRTQGAANDNNRAPGRAVRLIDRRASFASPRGARELRCRSLLARVLDRP